MVAILIALSALAGCGGGSGGGSGGSGSSGYTPGVYQPSSSYASKCALPRSGVDPYTHVAYPDLQGASTDENNFLRSWTNELYLWYSEVPDVNPASYTTVSYFPVLKTSATTPSGASKDRFHFTYPTSTWEQLSQSGVSLGYGAIFLVAKRTPPRRIVVAFVQQPSSSQASTPALTANLTRGATVMSIDGVDAVNATDQASVDKLNEALSPTTATSHTFVIQAPDASATRSVTMMPATVTETTVPVAQKLSLNGAQVGYILFNEHIATSEAELISAINKLPGVSDLFLDIRYNGGGYLDIADELAYMIAGPTLTGSGSATFEQIKFNDKHPTTDPVTGKPLAPTPFHTTTQGFSTTAGQPLPSLNLPRVFVLTGPDTCSASESIINGLRGVNVQVIQVGSTTCGKPYGFYPQDNCGTTYFSIEFQGVNAQGAGGYSDGFSPANTTSSVGVTLPGCAVGDDFTHNLGDPSEGLLKVALAYSTNPVCSVPPSGVSLETIKRSVMPSAQVSARSPLREMRILRP